MLANRTTPMRPAWRERPQPGEGAPGARAHPAPSYPAPVIAAAKVFDSTLAAVGGDPERSGGFGGGGFRPGGPPPPTFVGVNNTLAGQTNALENGDMAPTPAMLAAYAAACRDLGTA